MQDDLFNDLVPDDGAHIAARWAGGALGVIFFTLSALTTFQFFAEYAPRLGNLAGPDLAPFVAGAIGVLTLDAGCLLWSYVRTRASSTQAQMVLSGAVALLDLVGSLLTSALYIALSSSFEVGIYDGAGTLTQLGQSLHITGVVIITGALVANFAAVALWQSMSAATRDASQATTLRAVVADGRHKVATARTQATVTKTLHELGGALPAVTDEQARRNAERYLRSVAMPHQSAEDAPQATRPAEPSVNGSAHFLR